MPLVGFRPTKARLIIDDSNDTVLVMKVVVADSESVEFATGGKLDALSGVLRIRERKEGETTRNGTHPAGSLVYIEASGEGPDLVPAKSTPGYRMDNGAVQFRPSHTCPGSESHARP